MRSSGLMMGSLLPPTTPAATPFSFSYLDEEGPSPHRTFPHGNIHIFTYFRREDLNSKSTLVFVLVWRQESPGWTVGVTTVVHTVEVCTNTENQTAPVWHWLDQIAASNNMGITLRTHIHTDGPPSPVILP